MKKIVIPDRFKKIGIGLPIFVALNMVIKFFVYLPIAKLCNFGIGILLMFLASFILRYLVILVYDYFKEDVLLVEYFKNKQQQKQEVTEHTYATRQILKSQRSGNKSLLLVGLVCFDPIVTVLYCREGSSKWNNIPDKKTLLLFAISVLFCVFTIAIPMYGIFGLIDLII
jgi:hypothetical protein